MLNPADQVGMIKTVFLVAGEELPPDPEEAVNFGLEPRTVGIAVDPPVVAGENAKVPVLPEQDQRVSERLEPFSDPGFERLSGLAVMIIDERYS